MQDPCPSEPGREGGRTTHCQGIASLARRPAQRGLAAPSVKRTGRSFKAALNLAAGHDPRIANAAAWRTGLASLPDAESARNVILPEKSVRAVTNAAWDLDPELGLLVECAAVTGARVSQLERLEVGDLRADKSTPKLSTPTARRAAGQNVSGVTRCRSRHRLQPGCAATGRSTSRCCSGRARAGGHTIIAIHSPWRSGAPGSIRSR